MIDPEPPLVGQGILEIFETLVGDVLVEIHSVHAPPLGTAKGGVFGIVPEHDDIAGLGFDHGTRHLLGRHAPGFDALARLFLQAVGVGVAAVVAARYDAHCAAVARQRVQVEGDLDAGDAFAVVAVRVPAGVADLEVAVAAGLVEIVAQNAGGNVVDARIVEQTAEVFVLIGKGHDARARLIVVQFAVVAAAAFGPDALEFCDDAVDAVGQQAGKIEVR